MGAAQGVISAEEGGCSPALRWCRTSGLTSALVVIQTLQLNLPVIRGRRGLNSADDGSCLALLYADVVFLVRLCSGRDTEAAAESTWDSKAPREVITTWRGQQSFAVLYWCRTSGQISALVVIQKLQSRRRRGVISVPPCPAGICSSRDSEAVTEFTWESEAAKTELCRGGRLFPPVLRWCRTPGQTSALVELQKSCL